AGDAGPVTQYRWNRDPALLIGLFGCGTRIQHPHEVAGLLIGERHLADSFGEFLEGIGRPGEYASVLAAGKYHAVCQPRPEFSRQDKPALVIEPRRERAEEAVGFDIIHRLILSADGPRSYTHPRNNHFAPH